MKFSILPLTAVAVLALGAAAGAQTIPGPRPGQPAPDFSLTTTDGQHVSLASYRGKTLVINVWGSWCPPCRIETPDLVAEAKADGASVAFLGIDTTETAAVVRAFAAAKGIPYPEVATTSDSAFAKDYAITNYPTTIVVDPRGIVRAVHLDNLLPRAQLHAFIVAAKDGRSAPLISREQQRLDALLDPAAYPLGGDATAIRAGVARITAAIEKADNELDDAMSDASRDHDFLRTKDEEQTLRTKAIAALTPVATTDADRALLARLQGDAAAAAGDATAADRFYGDALALAPNDVDALSGRAAVAAKHGDLARALAYDRQIATADPRASTWMAAARMAGRMGDPAAASDALARALDLAQADVASHPGAPGPLRTLAWTNLYAGRTYVAVGRRDDARAAFDRALAAAAKLPTTDPRYEMYVEQAQEARVALDLAGTGATNATALTIAPWTGPVLPGSVPNTAKYRVVLTGRPGAALTLRAGGLPKSWIASFCTDKVCAPFRVDLRVPPSGVKVVELQVVPPDERATKLHPTVRVDVPGAGPAASVSAVVAKG